MATIENNNNNEQIAIDPSKKEEKREGDFNDIVKIIQKMSNEEKGEFINSLEKKDPIFEKFSLIEKSVLWSTIEYLDDKGKFESVKKYIEEVDLDNSKNEKITLEPNIDDLATLKAKFYRIGPDNELHSRYFTITNGENQKLATIKGEFDNWIVRARDYIDNKYQASDKPKSEVIRNQENTVKINTNLENNTIQEDNQITEQIETETIKTNKLIETQKSFFETNKNFASFNDLMTEKTINGSAVMVLDDNVYDALLRYEDNTEPLIKALAYKELNQANSELEASKKAISTSMQYKSENIDRAYQYSYEQFETKKDKILEDFKSVADDFKDLMKTDAGKLITSNTAFTSFESKLKTDINTQLGYEENTENETTLNIENNTILLLSNISKISNKLGIEINEIISSKKQSRLKIREKVKLKIDYTEKIENEIEEYSRKIGENLITFNAGIIKEGGTFNLPIGNGENIKLDFSSLGDISSLGDSEKIDLYNSKFDNIYRNDIGEKISDIIGDIWISMKENPGKTAIDITSIIFSGIGAVLVSEGSGTITAPLIAGPTFTALDNGYRAGMYEAFDIEGGWEAGLGINESDTHNDILIKKLFELGGNTALFGMFKATGLLEKKYLPKIDSQLKSMAIRTPIEAGFFTYYSVVSENLQGTVKNDGNIDELLNDFSEIPNFDVLMKSYIYNLGFITAVKLGAIPAEKIVINHYQKQLNNEMKRLQDKGFLMMDIGSGYAFFKGLNRVDNIGLKSFENFISLNKKVNYIAMEQYRKPESGRGGKAAYSTTFREQKFQKLEKYSKEAQSGKIDYVLNDKTIGKALTDNGIGNKGENVGKGLLKKSGFEKGEKIEPKTKFEKKAVKEMEKANMVIYKEYKDGISKLQKGLSLKDIYPNLSHKLILQLDYLYKKDNINISPKKEGKI